MICQVTLQAIQDSREVVYATAKKTPLVDSAHCSNLVGYPVYFKLENLQRTGSFKIRGASYKLDKLAKAGNTRAVMAISAGNHAQGIALASHLNGIQSTVFMPENAPLAKIHATRSYGAEVRTVGQNFQEAGQYAFEWLKQNPVEFISPFDDDDIITGQGTCGLELFEQLPEVETVVIPVGGGGLSSGMAIALKALKPSIKIIGVQAEAVPSMFKSYHQGKLVKPTYRPTIADGIAIKEPAQRNFEVLRHYLDDMVTVSEDAISHALFFAIQYKRIIGEGAGVVGLAALLEGKIKAQGPTAIVISGGNIDVKLLDSIINKGMHNIGRFLTLKTLISDAPGSLKKVLNLLAKTKANVMHVEHARFRANIPLSQTEVEFELEIRDADHAQEIMDVLEQSGYKAQRV